MTNVEQNVYPKDLTMSLASNHIEREVKAFSKAEDRIFVPDGGPFFSQSLIIKDNNGRDLKPQLDYKLLYLNEGATLEAGRDIVSVIWVMKETISSVLLDYRVVGGDYGNTVNAIMQEIKKAGPIQKNVDWNVNVYGKPHQFPPAPHFHTPDTFTGWQMVYEQLEGIRKAIITGDDVSWEAHYNYLNRLMNGLETNLNGKLTNYATHAQVSAAIALNKVVVDLSNYYTKAQTDSAIRIATDEVNNVADSLINYYTKVQSDARYPLKIDTYTKVESDGKYAQKSDYYTKGQSDGKYLTSVNLNGYFTTSLANQLETRLNQRIDGIADSIPQVDLSNYYTKVQVYTKGESDGKYAPINGSYTKGESDGKYSLKGDISSVTKRIDDLVKQLDALKVSSEMYKVGDIYVSSISHANATAVRNHHGYGTWVRFGNGEALVAVGHNDWAAPSPDRPTNLTTVGGQFGTYNVVLSADQMPKHNHELLITNYRHGKDGRWASYAYLNDGDVTSTRAGTKPADSKTVIGTAGSNSAHNNTQPSIAVSAWRRTA